MIPNQDELGIRYTLFSQRAIDAELFDDLWFTHGKDLSYEAALEQEIAEQQAAWEEECERLSVAAQEAGTDLVLDDFEPDLDNFDPQIEEPTIEGTYEGVHYRISWLGGAPTLWIFRSPFIGHFSLCSPCAPGACDGSSPTSRTAGHMGYDLPPDWRCTPLFADLKEEDE